MKRHDAIEHVDGGFAQDRPIAKIRNALKWVCCGSNIGLRASAILGEHRRVRGPEIQEVGGKGIASAREIDATVGRTDNTACICNDVILPENTQIEVVRSLSVDVRAAALGRLPKLKGNLPVVVAGEQIVGFG